MGSDIEKIPGSDSGLGRVVVLKYDRVFWGIFFTLGYFWVYDVKDSKPNIKFKIKFF